MQRIGVCVAAVVAACAASMSMSVVAQTTQRAPVDVRSMAPGAQPPEASAPAKTSGLTRDQRKEAAIQARQEGVLQPAGEAADPRGDKPVPLAVRGRNPGAPVVATTPPLPTAPVTASAAPPIVVAAAASTPAKKPVRKKASKPRPATGRAASAPA